MGELLYLVAVVVIFHYLKKNEKKVHFFSQLLIICKKLSTFAERFMMIDEETCFKTINDNYKRQLLTIRGGFCFCSNEMQQSRIWRAKQNKGNIINDYETDRHKYCPEHGH